MTLFNRHKGSGKDHISPSIFQTREKLHFSKRNLPILVKMFFVCLIISFMANEFSVLNFLTGENLPGIIASISHWANADYNEEKNYTDVTNSTPLSKSDAQDTKVNADNEPIVMSEISYLEILECTISQEERVIFHHYDDYNNDGTYEMFAIVANRVKLESFENTDDWYNGTTGDIWFINIDGAKKIEQEKEYYNQPDIYLVENAKFFVYRTCVRSLGLDDSCIDLDDSYLWGVNKDGEPYQHSISGRGYTFRINEYNEIELGQLRPDSRYDRYYIENVGTIFCSSWKPYYFYWDGTNFKEYGGKKIAIETLYSIEGAEELFEKIRLGFLENHGMTVIEIREIYYRENQVININFVCRKNPDGMHKNWCAALRRIKNDFETAYFEGEYRPALIPSSATFPKDSFENIFS